LELKFARVVSASVVIIRAHGRIGFVAPGETRGVNLHHFAVARLEVNEAVVLCRLWKRHSSFWPDYRHGRGKANTSHDRNHRSQADGEVLYRLPPTSDLTSALTEEASAETTLSFGYWFTDFDHLRRQHVAALHKNFTPHFLVAQGSDCLARQVRSGLKLATSKVHAKEAIGEQQTN
jgi:hypothetical protein